MPPDPKWTWEDDAGNNGLGTSYTVVITATHVKWRYDEDRYANEGEQTHADFVEFGPLWQSAPGSVLSEMMSYFGLSNPSWSQPAYQHYSPAWWAVSRSDEATAMGLLAAENPLRHFHKQRTLLMLASEKQLARVVAQLIDRGAPVNAQDDIGRTALIGACNQYCPSRELERLEIVKYLVQHGAEVNHCDASGRSALSYAASQPGVPDDLIEFLIHSGANQISEASACAIFHNNQALACKLIGLGATPWLSSPGVLREAVVRGWDTLAEQLLHAGSDPNYHDTATSPALMCAQSEKMVALLLAAGADPRFADSSGETALVGACWYDRTATVKLLLDSGADPNVQVTRDSFGTRGQTLLGAVIATGKAAAIVELLLKAGADPNGKGSKSAPPIHVAVRRGDLAAVQLLVAAGVDVNQPDGWGDRPLTHASVPAVAEALRAAGALA